MAVDVELLNTDAEDGERARNILSPLELQFGDVQVRLSRANGIWKIEEARGHAMPAVGASDKQKIQSSPPGPLRDLTSDVEALLSNAGEVTANG